MPNKPEFEILVETHSAEIFGYLWRLLGAGVDSEDCLQETFLRAFRAYPKLKNTSNLRAWLYRIATNTAYTSLRRHSRQASLLTDLSSNNYSTTNPSVPDQVEQRLTLIEIQRAVEALPEKQRAALMLRKYQELSYPEIAVALNCREETARANVYQALKKLRKQFAPQSDQQEKVG